MSTFMSPIKSERALIAAVFVALLAVLVAGCGGTSSSPTIYSITPSAFQAGVMDKDLTLTGTNFLPSTTATFAGVARTITYKSATSLVLSLSASELETVRTAKIVVSNPAPGGGSASIDLPILASYGTPLSRSQLAAGNQARLQRLIDKGRKGQPVTLAAIGGSITEGALASNSSHSYVRLVQAWWNTTFSQSTSTLVNAGIGATSSDYGSLRVKHDVIAKDPDLVIVEFAANDSGGGAQAYGDAYEGLLRQLFNAPSKPAVLLLFMMQCPVWNAQDWQSAIGAHYDLPMVSYYDAMKPELLSGRLQCSDISPDATHPNDLGHAYVSQFVTQTLATAITNFPNGTAFSAIPATPTPLRTDDFEFVSLVDGAGLNPSGNSGWIAKPGDALGDAGLQASTPGSTLDFDVKGRQILLSHLMMNSASAGTVRVTVDGGNAKNLDAWFEDGWGNYRAMTLLASGLSNTTHRVHLELLNSGRADNTFRVLALGTGGVQ